MGRKGNRTKRRNVTLSGGDIWLLMVVRLMAMILTTISVLSFECVCLCRDLWGQRTFGHKAVIQVQRCSHPATSLVSVGASINLAQGFFFFDLIDCWWLALMDMWLHAHVIQHTTPHMYRYTPTSAHRVSTYTLHKFTHLSDTLTLGFSTVSAFHWPYLTEGPNCF